MKLFGQIRELYEVRGRALTKNIAGKMLGGSKVNPNLVTVLGTIGNLLAAWIIYEGHFLLGAVVFLLGSLLDAMDGAVARVTGQTSKFGAFLDSTLDRISEGLVLTGLGLYFAGQDQILAVAACFVALAGSYLVSYTRARAEAIGVECKGGLASRVERVVLLAIGLAVAHWEPRAIELVVIILAAMSSITVAQRVFHVRSALLQQDRDEARALARAEKPEHPLEAAGPATSIPHEADVSSADPGDRSS